MTRASFESSGSDVELSQREGHGKILGTHRPTILQLVPALNEGGVERGALEIAQAIIAAGGRALVATAGGKMESQFHAIGAELVLMPLDRKNPVHFWQNARSLERLITRENVDLLHARSRGPAWSGWRASRRTNTPFVTTYHGAYNEGPPGKRLYNSVMARGRPIIAVSNFIAAMITDRHGIAPRDITTIPRGADLSIFDSVRVTADRVDALVQQWDLTTEKRPIFILPGRLTRWKGQEVFIDAAEILRQRRGEEAFLGLIVGSAKAGSDYAAGLNTRITNTRTNGCMRLVGTCTDMAAAYTLATCAISASTDPEAFGRVAVEAQAMSLPVIATDHGGGRETVAEGETGFRVPPGDAAALANAMEKILDLSDSQRTQFQTAAKHRVETHFSITRMQEATLAVYERVLGEPFPAHRNNHG